MIDGLQPQDFHASRLHIMSTIHFRIEVVAFPFYSAFITLARDALLKALSMRRLRAISSLSSELSEVS